MLDQHIDYLVIYVEPSAETLDLGSFGQTLVTHRFKNANLANYVKQETNRNAPWRSPHPEKHRRTSRSTQGARQ